VIRLVTMVCWRDAQAVATEEIVGELGWRACRRRTCARRSRAVGCEDDAMRVWR
jgi:hypothetical protein